MVPCTLDLQVAAVTNTIRPDNDRPRLIDEDTTDAPRLTKRAPRRSKRWKRKALKASDQAPEPLRK